MKIQKNIKIEEAINLLEAGEEALQQKLDNAEKAPVDLDDATVVEVAADIQKDAQENGQEISASNAVKEAKTVFEACDLIRNPYGTAKTGDVITVLQESLDDVLDQNYLNDISAKATGTVAFRNDFPNVLIYGSAGFAKTAIVKQFCREHKLNLFPLDAKTLDLATVSGIPYPVKDPKTGEWTQLPIASGIWKELERPNTVIFLDELNRARGDIRGTLLTLVNEHILPIATEDPKTGSVKIEKYFPNILFTVSAINPASDLYRDANELDMAEISRNAAIIGQTASVQEYYSYLKDLYNGIRQLGLADPNNPELQRIISRYNRQSDLAEAILTDPNFKFDDDNDSRTNARNARRDGKIISPLNYRTFFLTLKRTDGTKKGYLASLKRSSGFSSTRILMIENALRNYTDKPTKGNSIWNTTATSAQKQRAAKAQAAAEASMRDFINSI